MKWATDTWTSQDGRFIVYDKMEHAIRGAITFLLALGFGLPAPLLCTVLFALLWEVKDGYMDWQRWGFWGGDGFSWRDVVADFLGGLITAVVIVRLAI